MKQNDIGNPVKETCKALGITQKELAERIGVSKPTIERWSAKGDIPENAIRHLELLIDYKRVKDELDEIKSSLKTLSKHF